MERSDRGVAHIYYLQSPCLAPPSQSKPFAFARVPSLSTRLFRHVDGSKGGRDGGQRQSYDSLYDGMERREHHG